MGIVSREMRRGFTLLEILLALGIMGVIAIFAVSLAGSVREGVKVNETNERMAVIVTKAKAYYRNVQNLPYATVPNIDTPTEVPVGASELNLEQKYRYDGWGTPFRFYAVPTANNILDIDAYTVEGKSMAGALVSAGPDQKFSAAPAGIMTAGDIDTTEDDIIVAINVTQEATEIALEELRVLQDKIRAVDALYEGIDNGGAATVDEDSPGCEANPASGTTGCLPTTGLTNDPNCGTATLDYIVTDNYGCTATSVVGVLMEIYNLGAGYENDPWDNPYQWGCGPDSTGITCNSNNSYNYLTSDRQYHKVFSMGPDGGTLRRVGVTLLPTIVGATWDDDLVP